MLQLPPIRCEKFLEIFWSVILLKHLQGYLYHNHLGYVLNAHSAPQLREIIISGD